MKIHCSNCKAEIPSKEVNITSDIAKCPACGMLHKASDLMSGKESTYVTELYPPSGSKIDIYEVESGVVELTLPPPGLEVSTGAFGLGFSTFWLGFVAFWTFMATTIPPFPVNIFFGLFSIPFWIAGFAMARGLLVQAREYQVIRISPTHFTLVKNRPFFSKKYEFPLQEIQEISLKEPSITGEKFVFDWGREKNAMSPTIRANLKDVHFFQHIEPEEAKWLVHTLKELT